MRFLRTPIVALVLAAFLLVACGGSPHTVGDETNAQPQTQNSRFVSGTFAGLPLPAAAETYGSRTTKDGVTTQTYEIQGFTPKRVVGFYDDQLTADGWTTVQPPEAVGSTDYQGTWSDDAGRRLEVERGARIGWPVRRHGQPVQSPAARGLTAPAPAQPDRAAWEVSRRRTSAIVSSSPSRSPATAARLNVVAPAST